MEMIPMKAIRRWCAVLLAALVICALLPTQVLAAGRIDLSREVSLTVAYRNGETPLTGARFSLYLAAELNEYGELTVTDEFAGFGVDIRGRDDEAWRALAYTLEGYALRDNLTPACSGRTDSQGLLTLPADGQRLTPGLYLVLGDRCLQDGYYFDAVPFMAMLPALDGERNEWVYDVTVVPKSTSGEIVPGYDAVDRKVLKIWDDAGYEEQRPGEVTVQLLRDGEVYDTVELNADNNWRHTWSDLDNSFRWTVAELELKEYKVGLTCEGITFVLTNTRSAEWPEETPSPSGTPGALETPDPSAAPGSSEKPTDPSLPQTGQLWWPVPVLAAVGMLLVIAGLIRRRSGLGE